MKKPDPGLTVSVRWPSSVINTIKAMAVAEDRSFSYISGKAVAAWIQQQQTGEQPAPVAATKPAPAPHPATAGPKVTTKAEAKAAGATTYFLGTPCRNGHVAARYVGSGACVECAAANTKRSYANRGS